MIAASPPPPIGFPFPPQVRLRNPWGRGQWAGEWGPASPVWRGDRRYRLPNSDGSDGMFWMPYEEFLRYFSLIDVCKVCASLGERCACVGERAGGEGWFARLKPH